MDYTMLENILRRLGTMFYVVPPSSSTFKTVKEVPNYINEAIPWFIVLVLLEELFGRLQGRQLGRMCNNVTSISHAILYESTKLFTRWFEMSGYLWLYQFRIMDFEASTLGTWLSGFIAADFVYYWFHRASHEVSFIWSWHQVHHSHEDYNFTVAFRQSMFQRLFALGYYQPMALLGVPLPSICVHFQLNLLAQVVIHTEVVGRLGPLEWVLNTPSHHRVHHGANKYCLDKNYGGFLIIWDRLFGTFEAEKDDEEIVYGLVHQPRSSNVVWLEFFYIRYIIDKARSMSTWGDSIRALVYGPGWMPGTHRLGDPDTFPEVKGRAKYDPQLPLWQKLYTGTHFLAVLALQQVLTIYLEALPWAARILYFAFIIVSLGSITSMYDSWRWAPLLEVIRCGLYVAYASTTSLTGLAALDITLMTLSAISSLLWLPPSIHLLHKTLKSKTI